MDQNLQLQLLKKGFNNDQWDQLFSQQQLGVPSNEQILPTHNHYPHFSSQKYNASHNFIPDEDSLHIYKNTRWHNDTLLQALLKSNIPLGITQHVHLSQNLGDLNLSQNVDSADNNLGTTDENDIPPNTSLCTTDENDIPPNISVTNMYHSLMPYLKELCDLSNEDPNIIEFCKQNMNNLVKLVSCMYGANNCYKHCDSPNSSKTCPNFPLRAKDFQSCYQVRNRKTREKRKKGNWEM